MAEIEKYIAKRINKDFMPGAVQADGTRMMLPGELVDALNCRIGIDGVVKSVPGNILSVYSNLGAGDNKVIGAFEYQKNNTVICFVYNSLGNHRVFEWNAASDTFITLLEGSSLLFSLSNYVTGGGVLDDLLIWNDGLNPIRFININDAKNGLYVAPYSKYRLALATQPPLDPPTINIVTDLSVIINNIVKSTFQFAYNFIYTDNRESVYSPLSKLAWVRPYNEPDDNVNNGIDVTVTIPSYLLGIVKSINLVYREGNLGLYNIWEQIKNPDATSYTRRFFNNGKSIAVSAEDQNLLADSIPSVTKALEIIRNRIFCSLNNEGFDVDDSTFNLSVSLGEETAVVPTFIREGRSDYVNVRYLKDGGVYGIGIVFFDDFGKKTFVKKTTVVNVPFGNIGRSTTKKFLNWTLTGSPPPGFTKYQIVLSANRFHANYFQCVAIPHLYVRDIKEGEENNTQTDNTYNFAGKMFLKLDKIYQPGEPRVLPGWQKVYLQIPFNAPFVPDTSCLVRFSDTFGRRFINVLGVDGDFVIIDLRSFEPEPVDPRDDIPQIEWIDFNGLIEIFKPADSFETVYYETGKAYNIVNGAFETLTDRLNGDTYNLRFTKQGGWEYSPRDVIVGDPIPTGITKFDWVFESPTGIFSSVVATVPAAILSYRRGAARGNETGNESQGSSSGTVTTASSTETKIVYSLDYNKASSDYGRAHGVFDEERKKDFYNVVAFSNPYVENSYINGLSKFLPENQYPLPVDRGPIISLIKVGNVLLAIHERYASTLYIGEGLIRQGSDFILAKTENVVGDDRILQGGHGCINPESVNVFLDQAYWWDAYRGAVVRYTNAGLYPVSHYGMRNYFATKGRQLLPYRNSVKVVTAYDYLNDEFLITFTDVKDGLGTILIPGETWAFNTIRNEWKTRYSFVPESYATTETYLLSFLNGQLWQHNKGSVFNNFYGVQYDRRWKFIANPRLGKNKRWMNIHIKGVIAGDPQSEFVPVRIKTKEGQETFIPAYEFEMEEGKLVAAILKDINSTPPDEESMLALRSGEDIISEYAEVELINDRTDEGEVSQVNMVYMVEEFSA